MTQPNDSFLRNPDGAGTALPTHLVGGKEYPVVMEADADGHIVGSPPAYLLYQHPRVTTAAATDFFDIFNAAGSGKVIRVRGLWPVIQVTAASAVVPSWEFHLYRTSAVGTGGVAGTYNSATAPSTGGVNITPLDSTASALPAQITARSLPTAGATAQHFVFPLLLTSEETNPAAYLFQGINFIPELAHDQPLEIQEGQGLKLRQVTATASTGTNFGWLMAFTLP